MWAIICAASVILFPLIGMLIGSKKLNLSYQAGKMIFQEKKDEDAEKQYDSQYKMIRALLGSQTAYGIAEALLILIRSGMIKGGYQPAFMTTSRICAALAAALISLIMTLLMAGKAGKTLIGLASHPENLSGLMNSVTGSQMVTIACVVVLALLYL